MEYGDFKPHEADIFELDHVIAYKQSSKFNLRNVSMEVNLENFLTQKLPASYTVLKLNHWMYVVTVAFLCLS